MAYATNNYHHNRGNSELSKNTTEYSKSKQKRIAIQEAAQKEARRQTRNKVIGGVVIAAIICAIGATAFQANAFHIKTRLGLVIEPSSDYSADLTDEGLIKNVNTADYVGTFDPSTITLSEDDVTYSDDDWDSYVQSLVESNRTVSTDTSLAAASGDTLNINYAGTIDGVAFDGGTAEDQDLELGSGTFIDGFEDQLVGSHPGDDVTVNVTFPEDYGSEELNGQDAVFEVHVNGIYLTPEFNDAFVAENLSESGYTTAAEYEEHYRAEQTASLYASAIDTWIGENVTPESYPAAYLRQAKALQMTTDESNYNYYQSLYTAYGMSFDYDSYEDFYASEDQTYEEYRDAAAETSVTKALVYQNVFENAGLSITDEEYQAYLDENSLTDENVETYGKGYIMQQIIREKAAAYMQDLVAVEAATEDAEAADSGVEIGTDGATVDAVTE